MLPHGKPPSLRIHPARTWIPRSTLTTGTLKRMVMLLAAAVTEGNPFRDSRRPADDHSTELHAENRDIFCMNRNWVKVLQSLWRCAPGVSKGGGSCAGATGIQRPFGLLLLVLFLQEQEKNKESLAL